MQYFFDPLEQFELSIPTFVDFILSDYIVDASFTNYIFLISAFFLDFIVALLGLTHFTLSIYKVLFFYSCLVFLTYYKGGYMSPRNWQTFAENIYKFLASSFREQVGYRGQKYFPFLSSIFFFVLLLNIFGMLPYEGAVTSQMVYNLSLSFTVLFVLTIIGVARQHWNFFKLFLPPSGMPKPLMPLLVFIEVVSYISRGISLGVRLFANIMAGHTLLFIFSSFIVSINILLGLSVFLVIFLVTFLEFFIASLQAYVFYVLVIIYFRDSIEVSH